MAHLRLDYARALSALFAAALGVALLATTTIARAVPAFARQYGTSCETCHTVFPVLTPFGEAFRRNGFRWPGRNSENLQQEPVPMGQDAYRQMFPNAVWPSSVPMGVPLAVGVNGGATIHPQTDSSAGRADGGNAFSINGLTAEAHLWAAGPIDDQITYFIELTAADGGIEVEKASVQFGDLFGPAHVINLAFGKRNSTLSLFGPHSSYLVDSRWLTAPVGALFGADSDAWDLWNNFDDVELNGVIAGIFSYAIGVNAGTNLDFQNSQDAYAMLGLKLGGMRLDGEPGGATQDAQHPWAETAVSFDIFGQTGNSRFSNPTAITTAGDNVLSDRVVTFGGSARMQLGSFVLDAGARYENHNHAVADVMDGSKAEMIATWGEASYVVFPWLVPAVRFEYLNLNSALGEMGDYRLTLGAVALIRANIKVSVSALFEGAGSRLPPGGWGSGGGFANPQMPGVKPVDFENEGLYVNLFYAF